MFKNQSGFTLIELLMVTLLVAILAVVAVPQFLDFQTEAKNAATSGALGALRTAIANQKANMIMRCGAAADAWPVVADVSANSINNTSCAATPVASANDPFMSGGIPKNPWTGLSTVIACAGGGCTSTANACDGTGTRTDGWCYNPATGGIWADSSGDTEYTL